VPFTGTDIEDWPGHSDRVAIGDAADPSTYPNGALVVTSPVYPNGVADHFQARDLSSRNTYRSVLGRPLHHRNMGRYSTRGRADPLTGRYWDLARNVIAVWADLELAVVLNTKAFARTYHGAEEIVDVPGEWELLLMRAGYIVTERDEVPCPGNRFGANGDRRADHEVVIVAEVVR
jgi:hypothetical protein